MKTCYKCKIEKELTCFVKSSQRKDGLNPLCKDCSKEWRTINKEKLSKKKAEYYRKDIEYSRAKLRERYKNNKESFLLSQRQYYSTVDGRIKKLLMKVKERAAKDNLEFNIDVSDIIIPEYCPYLKIKLTHDLGKGQLFSNSSLDRIDSTKGYVKGNVQVISRLANTMKSNSTKDQLITFAKSILEMENKHAS